jgi:hypothetical protein
MNRKVRRIHWYTAEKEKLTIRKLLRVKRNAFLISLIILSDLSTIQSRLTFEGHKSLKYCCLVMYLTSLIHHNFLHWIERWYFFPYWVYKTRDKAQQKVNRESPRLIERKLSSKKGIQKT